MPPERTYQVQYLPSAWKEITSFPDKIKEALFTLAESLELDPRPHGCKKLKGSDSMYRIRSGDYRVLYKIEDNILLVLVVAVGDRKEVYKKK